MTYLLAIATFSTVSAFATLAGWFVPEAVGSEAAAAWLAFSASAAVMSASALDG